jgi:hypothetical protein
MGTSARPTRALAQTVTPLTPEPLALRMAEQYAKTAMLDIIWMAPAARQTLARARMVFLIQVLSVTRMEPTAKVATMVFI